MQGLQCSNGDLDRADQALFDQLAFGARDCVVAIFGETAARVAITYPHTYFLYSTDVRDRVGVDGLQEAHAQTLGKGEQEQHVKGIKKLW